MTISQSEAGEVQNVEEGPPQQIQQFCDSHPAVEPRKECSQQESILLSREAGLYALSYAPISNNITFVADVPRSEIDAYGGRYLWVVCPVEVRYALEATPIEELECIKHSNLTEAKPAICAGEAWFVEPNKFGFNGKSGRYGIDDPDMLRSIEDLFVELGYTVASTGFDHDAGRSLPHFTEGEVTWRGGE